MAGTWLTDLNNRNAQLWSVAKQLFEAIDFMHQHNVAHLDLKPANVIIPVNGGRLTIIDFNRSVRVKGVDDMFSGIVGTDGYLPPEIKAGRGLYSAIRADLWSCGKTLHELCASCWPSADRDALLEICRQLMNEDPKKRPMMSDVLERMSHCKVDNTAQSALSCQR
jgi:serine/threonine protein kinase